MLEKIPAGCFGALEDLVGATVFLCSGSARYVTGQLLYIDGDYMASIGLRRRGEGPEDAVSS